MLTDVKFNNLCNTFGANHDISAVNRTAQHPTDKTNTNKTNNMTTETTTILTDIMSRNTSAQFDIVNEGNVYKIFVCRYDVSFDDFLNILDEMNEKFGDRYSDFDEDGASMVFTIDQQ